MPLCGEILFGLSIVWIKYWLTWTTGNNDGSGKLRENCVLGFSCNDHVLAWKVPSTVEPVVCDTGSEVSAVSPGPEVNEAQTPDCPLSIIYAH